MVNRRSEEEEKMFQEWKDHLTSLLVASKSGICHQRLKYQLSDMLGVTVPFEKMGFSNWVDFLFECREVFDVGVLFGDSVADRYAKKFIFVQAAAVDEGTLDLLNMVTGQEKSKTKKRKDGKVVDPSRRQVRIVNANCLISNGPMSRGQNSSNYTRAGNFGKENLQPASSRYNGYATQRPTSSGYATQKPTSSGYATQKPTSSGYATQKPTSSGYARSSASGSTFPLKSTTSSWKFPGVEVPPPRVQFMPSGLDDDKDDFLDDDEDFDYCTGRSTGNKATSSGMYGFMDPVWPEPSAPLKPKNVNGNLGSNFNSSLVSKPCEVLNKGGENIERVYFDKNMKPVSSSSHALSTATEAKLQREITVQPERVYFDKYRNPVSSSSHALSTATEAKLQREITVQPERVYFDKVRNPVSSSGHVLSTATEAKLQRETTVQPERVNFDKVMNPVSSSSTALDSHQTSRAITSVCFDKEIEQVISSPPSDMSPRPQQVPRKGQLLQIIIIKVDLKDIEYNFVFRKKVDHDVFSVLEKEFETFYKSTRSEQLRVKNPTLGFYAAKCTVTNKWFRVELRKLPERMECSLAFAFDYGKFILIDIESGDLRYIKEKFITVGRTGYYGKVVSMDSNVLNDLSIRQGSQVPVKITCEGVTKHLKSSAPIIFASL